MECKLRGVKNCMQVFDKDGLPKAIKGTLKYAS